MNRRVARNESRLYPGQLLIAQSLKLFPGLIKVLREGGVTQRSPGVQGSKGFPASRHVAGKSRVSAKPPTTYASFDYNLFSLGADYAELMISRMGLLSEFIETRFFWKFGRKKGKFPNRPRSFENDPDPCGNFSDTSSLKFQRTEGSIGRAFTVCVRTGHQNQASFYPSVLL